MKIRFSLLLALMPIFSNGQNLISPDEFLGYRLGKRFTPHHRVVAYFEHVAKNSDMVALHYYGESYEHRPLLVAYISSAANLSNKEDIRRSNLHRTGLESSSANQNIPIVWLSYNVHGNEAVSSEASMKTLYALVDPSNSQTKSWLENTLIIMDPCINPDGRDRYVNWYNQIAHQTPNADMDDLEHHEPWPGGRTNHYLFDLNRDWAWQSQQETQHRITLYNQWFPHVHVDFHEQGLNNPYYFAPAAEPYHDLITPWQRDFQTRIGRNHARYFDQKGWLYFTKEVYDLLYPSYGDTYPIFNGAIGMTYEQGGSSRAGLQVIMDNQDTLTLKDRIDHHYTTSLSTVEVTSMNAQEVIREFERYYRESQINPNGIYKSFIIKGSNDPQKLSDLMEYLDRQMIAYGSASGNKTFRGFSYRDNSTINLSLEPQDLVISAYQPKSVLAQVLFDPNPRMSDSMTYDITSWALPYQYDLEAYALTERISTNPYQVPQAAPGGSFPDDPYGYVAPWKNLKDARWLAHLLKNGIKVRFSEEPFTIDQQRFEPGTLLVARADNEDRSDFHEIIQNAARDHQRQILPVASGWVESGSDFGAGSFTFIETPKVAVISGDQASSLSYGELWHYFEQQLHYPFTNIDQSYFDNVDLSQYSVLILPDGRYHFEDRILSALKEWVNDGGRMVLIGNALNAFADKEGFSLKTDTTEEGSAVDIPKIYKDRERTALSDNIPGAIFKVNMDNSHPLAFGYNSHYFTLKTDDLTFPYLEDEWNVGTIADPTALVSGFAGTKILENQKQVLVFGVEELGSGQVIYLVDNPLFRAFWYQGKLLMANAIFMVGQ